MKTKTPFTKMLALLFATLLTFGSLAACSDEDGDGATTDEEVDEIDKKTDDLGDDIQNEIDKGKEEVDENNDD